MSVAPAAKMKAVVVERFGPLDSIVLGDLPRPDAGPGEVVIEAAYAGVNFFDTLIAKGRYQIRPDTPFAPGGEVSGHVAAVGEGVEGFRVGDRVAAATGWGAFGELVAVPASQAFRLPDEVSLETAAVLLESYGTAYHALKDCGRLAPGEELFVLGSAGGTGTAAVQVGAAMGARTVAGASTEEKLAYAAEHGAEETIDYGAGDLRAELKRRGGVDVVFDPVGGELTEPAFRGLRPGGRHLVVGFAAGRIPALPLNLPLLKRASIVGVYWGAFRRSEVEANRENTRQLLEWVREGRIRPRAERVLPLDEAVPALTMLEQRRAVGKIALRVRG